MRYRPLSFLLAAFALLVPVSKITAQESNTNERRIELDGSELNRQMREREDKIKALPPEEREKVRAAHQKAAADPEVRAAVAKRDQAIREFQAVVRETLLQDPEMAPILEKLNQPARGR